jgi:sRNA-binding protein
MRKIDRVLFERLSLADDNWRMLRITLSAAVNRPSYLKALAAEGAMRCDLDGNPVEPVSDEHRELAQASLDKLVENQARKATPKQPAGIDRAPASSRQ